MNRLLVAVPVVGAAAFLLGQQGASAPVSAPPAPSVIAPRDPVVSKLRAEVDALRADIAARPLPAAIDEPPPEPEPAEPPTADEQLAAHVARYASAMASDPVDTAWSSGAERSLRAAFAAPGPTDPVLDDVTCRATLCRLGLRFPSADAKVMGAPLLPSRVPWDTAGIMEEDEDDPTRVILYAARSADLAPSP